MGRIWVAAATTAALLASAGAAGLSWAQGAPPPGERTDRPGRYTMQPADGGFLRLDTETGAVSLCSKRGASFACEPVQDQAGALRAEVDRLKTENGELRAEVERLSRNATGPDVKPDGEPRKGGKLSIPSEKEVDEAMDYLERIYKKFRERIRRLEKESDGRGTPL